MQIKLKKGRVKTLKKIINKIKIKLKKNNKMNLKFIEIMHINKL